MAHFASTIALDLAFDYWSDVNEMHICTQQPINYSEVATRSLGKVTLTPSAFTRTNIGTAGRRLSVGAQIITPTQSGTYNHIALIKTSESSLRRVHPSAPKPVVAGTAVTIGTFPIDLSGPNE
jgi:hypothetical protein